MPRRCLYSRPADRNDDFTNVTPKLGLSYALTDEHTLYASARARLSRAGYERALSAAAPAVDRRPRPRATRRVELGARGAFGPLRYSLAGFVMEKDNVIFRDANGFNVSDGRTDHRGVEYELTWSPIDTLSLALAGTYAKHTYDFDRDRGRRDHRRRPGRRHGAAPRQHRAAQLAVPAGRQRRARMDIDRPLLRRRRQRAHLPRPRPAEPARRPGTSAQTGPRRCASTTYSMRLRRPRGLRIRKLPLLPGA